MSKGEFTPAARALIDLRANERCERCGRWSPNCQRHHRRPRGMGGSSRPDTALAANGLRLCSDCHDIIEGKVPQSGVTRTVSKRMGWLIEQGKNPEAVRVKLWDGWFLLTNDGRRLPIKAPKHVE